MGSGVIPDAEIRAAVANLLYAKLAGDRRFVSRTDARGFLHLTSARSRIGQKGIATVGPVSGGLRFSTPDRLVVIERCGGYRVLVRSLVGGYPVVLYDRNHAVVDSIAPALLDLFGG